MVNGRNQKTVPRYFSPSRGYCTASRLISRLPGGAVALLFALYLALIPPVMAEESVVSREAGAKLTADNAAGYEKIIALLQEQDKKNSREFRQLKREIAALGQQLDNPGIAEIMGGIGYIFGLFGVAAYIMSRKKNISGEH